MKSFYLVAVFKINNTAFIRVFRIVIHLHANGYKPLDFTVDKADGVAEVAD